MISTTTLIYITKSIPMIVQACFNNSVEAHNQTKIIINRRVIHTDQFWFNQLNQTYLLQHKEIK